MKGDNLLVVVTMMIITFLIDGLIVDLLTVI